MAVFCMKCGKEIPEQEVFCPDCLADMSRHPVRPGTPIQLHARPAKAPQKQTSRKKERSPEKTIRRQRRAITFLSILLVIALGFLCYVSYLLWENRPAEIPDTTIGQNYSAVESGGE